MTRPTMEELRAIRDGRLPPRPNGRGWPRLSRDLKGPRALDRCQCCGVQAREDLELDRWQEHDDNDQPEPVVVVLCRQCSGRLIEPRPRAYRRLPRFEPFPGAMELCTGCRHQDGLGCQHPDLKANGGPGLRIEHPRPIVAHVLRQTRQGRRGGWVSTYSGPATGCAGRDPSIG